VSVADSVTSVAVRLRPPQQKPHIFDPHRPLIMKKHRSIINRGNIHHKENAHDSYPHMVLTSLGYSFHLP
jgi:hypothetical protein